MFAVRSKFDSLFCPLVRSGVALRYRLYDIAQFRLSALETLTPVRPPLSPIYSVYARFNQWATFIVAGQAEAGWIPTRA